MIKLYDYPLSGHAHRARLFLSLLNIPYENIETDLAGGQHKSPEFLAMNPFGEVPVLVDGDAVVRDSNAILVYLANKYAPEWNPQAPAEAAEVQAWLTTASKEITGGPGAARLVIVFNADRDLDKLIKDSHAFLAVFDNYLNNHEWLALNRPTIADVSAYSYVATAPEGNVSLDEYPQVRSWLTRVEALPGFVAMPPAFDKQITELRKAS